MTNNKNDSAKFLGSATTDDIDIAAFRASLEELSKGLNGLDDILDEPLKGQFLKTKADVNKALAGLPDTDKAPAALEASSALRQLCWAFRTVQEMTSQVTGLAKTAHSQVATLRASMPQEIQTAIDDRVKKGELLSKEDHDKLITKAKDDARALFSTELKTISDRRAKVTEAKLPVPTDEVLSGEKFDEQFTEAKSRTSKLALFSLPPAEVVNLTWSEPKEGFDRILGLMSAQRQAKNPGPHPFAGGGNPPKQADENSKTERSKLGVI